jgi:fucose permease
MRTEIDSKNKLLILCGCFAAFFIYGVIENVRGPIMGPFLTSFNLSYSAGGMVFSGLYIGSFVSVIFFGLIGGKIGNLNLVVIGSLLIALGSLSFSVSPILFLLVVSMVVIGLGLGSVEIGVSALLSEQFLTENKAAKYLLLAGFFHGLGSMSGAFAAGKALQYSITWQKVYIFVGVMSFLLVLFLLTIHLKEIVKTKEKQSLRVIKKVFFQKEMLFFYTVIFGYVGLQTGMSTWLAEYLTVHRNIDPESSTIYVTSFFICLTVGRFLGSFIVDKVGHLKSMFICVFSSCCLVFLSTFGGDFYSFCLPLTGLFVSIIFPTSAAMMSQINVEHLVLRFGFLFVFAGLGGIFGPWGIGILCDVMGIHSGISLGLILLSILMLLPFVFSKRIFIERSPIIEQCDC